MTKSKGLRVMTGLALTVLLGFLSGCPLPTEPEDNTPPTVSIDEYQSESVWLVQGSRTQLTAEGRDADGADVSYRWSVEPAAGVSLTNDDTDRVTVLAEAVGSYTVTVTVSDGADSATASRTIAVASADEAGVRPATGLTNPTQPVDFFELDGTALRNVLDTDPDFAWTVFNGGGELSRDDLIDADTAYVQIPARLPAGTYGVRLTARVPGKTVVSDYGLRIVAGDFWFEWVEYPQMPIEIFTDSDPYPGPVEVGFVWYHAAGTDVTPSFHFERKPSDSDLTEAMLNRNQPTAQNATFFERSDGVGTLFFAADVEGWYTVAATANDGERSITRTTDFAVTSGGIVEVDIE